FLISTRLVPVSLRVRVGDVSPPASPGAYKFAIPSPSGGPLLDAEVSAARLEDARERWRTRTWAVTLGAAGLTLLFWAGAMFDFRARARTTRAYLLATAAAVGAVVACRLVFTYAITSAVLDPLLTSAIDVFVDAIALITLVWLVLDGVERWRLAGVRPRLLSGTVESIAWTALSFGAAGMIAAAIVWRYSR